MWGKASKWQQLLGALIKAARRKKLKLCNNSCLSLSSSVVKKVIMPTDAPKDTWPFSVDSEGAAGGCKGAVTAEERFLPSTMSGAINQVVFLMPLLKELVRGWLLLSNIFVTVPNFFKF